MSVLSAALRVAVSSEFRDVVLSRDADFRPMANFERGELSSSAAIEIARVTKRDARDVADRLIQGLSRDFPGEWRSDAGYIVCRGISSKVALAEVAPDARAALARADSERGVVGNRTIWCCVPDVTEPVYARVRLVARAAMHALVVVACEGECRVGFEPEGERTLSSPRDVARSFRDVVRYILSHESEVRRDVGISRDVAGPDRSVFVWTSHHYHDRLTIGSRQTLTETRQRGGVVVKMPSDGWLLSRDRALSELLGAPALLRIVSQLASDDQWLRFLFHAASSVPSGDFDPAVALFDECASPLWSLRLLVDRYSRFGSFLPLPVGVEALPRLLTVSSPDLRALALRGAFLPLYTAQAILQGEVAEWAVAIEEFARLGHAFLNAPATRMALHQGDFSGEVGEIVASVGFGLSSILGVVAEGTCADQ